jgi:hypothetical protein
LCGYIILTFNFCILVWFNFIEQWQCTRSSWNVYWAMELLDWCLIPSSINKKIKWLVHLCFMNLVPLIFYLSLFGNKIFLCCKKNIIFVVFFFLNLNIIICNWTSHMGLQSQGPGAHELNHKKPNCRSSHMRVLS